MINYLSKLNSVHSKKTLGHQLSNFLIHEGVIYIASGNSVFAFSLSGDLQWQHQLPQARYGRCKIFYHNEGIYVVNYGNVPYETFYYGNVFIGLLDINTGHGKISAKINQKDQTYIKDFLLTDSSMITVLNNSIKEIALDDLRIFNDHPFNNPQFSTGFRHLAPPPYHILTDDTLQNRSAKYPKLIFVENNNGLKIELSEDYQLKEVIPKARFFYTGNKSEDYSVLYNDTRILITNDSLQMFPIRFSHNMFNTGEYFCDWDENRIIIIPEKSVIEWLQKPN